MDLKQWIEGGRDRARILAAALQIKDGNPVLISQWANGVRPVPFERCTAIELATGGEVSRRDLRPLDWHLHWPELVGAN